MNWVGVAQLCESLVFLGLVSVHEEFAYETDGDMILEFRCRDMQVVPTSRWRNNAGKEEATASTDGGGSRVGGKSGREFEYVK